MTTTKTKTHNQEHKEMCDIHSCRICLHGCVIKPSRDPHRFVYHSIALKLVYLFSSKELTLQIKKKKKILRFSLEYQSKYLDPPSMQIPSE